MIIVLSTVVFIQVILLACQLFAWANPELGARFNNLIPNRNNMDLIIASIGTLIVGPGMILVAYFKDFPRGYFIAIMIALLGLVLFVRFLHKYPLRRQDASHE